jgi:hypothetical protein
MRYWTTFRQNVGILRKRRFVIPCGGAMNVNGDLTPTTA